MKKQVGNLLSVIICFGLVFIPCLSFAAYYNRRLCAKPEYTCIRIRRGDTWQKLWPNPKKRRIVMRINRMNGKLYPGLKIAVPNSLINTTHMDFNPLPYFIKPRGRRVVIIDLSKHAFGAYDTNGVLIHWGPVSGGKGWCPDVRRRCNTPRGNFRVLSRGSAYCKSTKYPVPRGGAPMPYCMYFYKGYAMHASDLPGYHASHGCVRLFYEDAKWLNKVFSAGGKRGTQVIVR